MVGFSAALVPSLMSHGLLKHTLETSERLLIMSFKNSGLHLLRVIDKYARMHIVLAL